MLALFNLRNAESICWVMGIWRSLTSFYENCHNPVCITRTPRSTINEQWGWRPFWKSSGKSLKQIFNSMPPVCFRWEKFGWLWYHLKLILSFSHSSYKTIFYLTISLFMLFLILISINIHAGAWNHHCLRISSVMQPNAIIFITVSCCVCTNKGGGRSIGSTWLKLFNPFPRTTLWGHAPIK